MKLTSHSRIRLRERIDVRKSQQKQFFKRALMYGKCEHDFENNEKVYKYLLNLQRKRNCQVKVYKGYIFIHSKVSKTLYTVYEIPENIKKEIIKKNRI